MTITNFILHEKERKKNIFQIYELNFTNLIIDNYVK